MRFDRRRYRDFLLLRLSATHDRIAEKQSTPIVAFLVGQGAPELDRTVAESSDIGDYPYVFLEGDRQDIGINETYWDPPDSGSSTPTLQAITKWSGFAYMSMSSRKIEEHSQQQYAFMLLERAVAEKKQDSGVNSTLQFIARLHNFRWSLGCEMTAQLAMQTRAGTAEELQNVSDDTDFLMRYIRETRDAIEKCKTASHTLTEWGENLHLTRPSVWELIQLLSMSNWSEAKKWHRYFCEIDADISPALMTNMFCAISQLSGDQGPNKQDRWPTQTNVYLRNNRESSQSFEEFRQKLEYQYVARTTYPKFWFDLACECYDLADEELPSELSLIEPYSAVSIDVLSAASSTWRHSY